MSNAPDWATLTEGEEVRFHGRPSIFPYLGGELGSLLVVAFGVLIALVGLGTGAAPVDLPVPSLPIPAIILLGLSALLVAVGLLGMGGTMLRWWSIEHLVTTQEVYEKRGIFSRSVTNLPVDRIQKTNFDQSVPGRLLSYGTVRIGSAGTSDAEIVFRHAKHPDRMVAEITEQIGE